MSFRAGDSSARTVGPKGDRQRRGYDPLQMTFHWAMALIILVALGLGLWASFITRGVPLRKAILEVHKSLGMTAFVLIVFRILYRLASRMPPDNPDRGEAARMAAHAAHATLYALMVVMPVSGYIFSAAGGYSLPWFGLFQWPRVLSKDAAVSHTGQAVHGWGAWVLYIVVFLHIAAVAWHQFVRKDGVLARMLPRRR